MSNATNQLSPASRAMLVGAMVGGAASASAHWKEHKTGELDTNALVNQVVKDSVKAAAVSGATTYVAGKMAGRPALSMLTLLSAGAAGLYWLSQNNPSAKD